MTTGQFGARRKYSLAGYKLSNKDLTDVAEDGVQELHNYGQWENSTNPN